MAEITGISYNYKSADEARVMKNNAVITGSLSMGRAENSDIGENSTALGKDLIVDSPNTTTVGMYNEPTGCFDEWEANKTYVVYDCVSVDGVGYMCLAFGDNIDDYPPESGHWYALQSNAKSLFTVGGGASDNNRRNVFDINQLGGVSQGAYSYAHGSCSHAEGQGTIANGALSHAEGCESRTYNECSHAEGRGTETTGSFSHADGYGTIASGTACHVEGYYNIEDPAWDEWVSDQSYEVGDKVTYMTAGYICKTANRDTQFIQTKWLKACSNSENAFIIGNGMSIDARSNATVITWDGDIKTAGSLTIGAGTADEVTITAYQLRKLIAMIPEEPEEISQ